MQCHTRAKKPGQNQSKTALFVWLYGNSLLSAGGNAGSLRADHTMRHRNILVLQLSALAGSSPLLFAVLQEAGPTDDKLKPPDEMLALLNFTSQFFSKQFTHESVRRGLQTVVKRGWKLTQPTAVAMEQRHCHFSEEIYISDLKYTEPTQSFFYNCSFLNTPCYSQGFKTGGLFLCIHKN